MGTYSVEEGAGAKTTKRDKLPCFLFLATGENASRGGQDSAQSGSVWEKQSGTICGGRVLRGLLKIKIFNAQLKLFVLL